LFSASGTGFRVKTQGIAGANENGIASESGAANVECGGRAEAATPPWVERSEGVSWAVAPVESAVDAIARPAHSKLPEGDVVPQRLAIAADDALAKFFD
jgi:hypothetical protein